MAFFRHPIIPKPYALNEYVKQDAVSGFSHRVYIRKKIRQLATLQTTVS